MIDKLDYTKIKNFCLSKVIETVKGKLKEWKKYYISAKGLVTECKMNPRIIKRINQSGKARKLSLLVVFFFFFFFLLLFRAAPLAYGGSQARGLIRAAAACLHHSHSNTGSEPRLTAMPAP